MRLGVGKFKINWDALGTGASFLCAVHCAALPLLLSIVPFMNIHSLENPVIEYSLLSSSFFIGYLALYRGYKYHHRNIIPVFLFIIGFPVLVWGHIGLSGPLAQVLIGCAALLIITAHILNWTAHKNCSAAAAAVVPSSPDSHPH